jgi:hypothetical protein
MLKKEALPSDPVRIKPLSYWRVHPPRSPVLLDLLDDPRPLKLNFAIGSGAVGAPHILPGPNIVLEMHRRSIGSFVVIDGWPGEVVVGDPSLVKIAPDAPVIPGDRCLVVDNPQTFKVFSGKELGRTTITASVFGSTASLDLVVKTFFTPPPFIPGDDHGHTPCRNWPAIQANTNSSFLEDLACKNTDPQGVADLAIRFKFDDKPIGLKHLKWYLRDGKGADFVEDDNISDWLKRDGGIRRRLKREIFPRGKGKPRTEGHFKFEQEEYDIEDFQFAFGAIDRVDFEVDLSQDTVRVSFKDRYEWHPVYPTLYTLKPGDVVRDTNCVHAAMVELKDSGAADFWMKGQAEVLLSLIAMA